MRRDMRHRVLVMLVMLVTTLDLGKEWYKIMCQNIKLENGDRWSVRGREIKGIHKTQVTYRFQDGFGMKNPRSAVFFPYDWSS